MTKTEYRPAVWPWIVMAVAGLVTFVGAMTVPPDAVQGQLSRIMYVHVPSAWLAYLAFGITMLTSAIYLWRRDLKWDRLALASAEIGVVFTGLAIALGMIWAKPTWGVWWTWDARLTLTAIMFFVYLGYLALRRTTDDLDTRARRASVLGVLAVVQVPLVHFSVVWWRSLHQGPSLIKPESPTIDTSMLVTLLVAVVSFTLMYGAMMFKRIELARFEDAALVAEQTSLGPVAGEAVTVPDLTKGA
ncbi:MAG: cytochrome c biogenesis protein CcsA [Acidimicrobiia bacterium]|nr:MAG: cytochrome c biogenesis protein CcsA [Acidimicrobiia bacterium]